MSLDAMKQALEVLDGLSEPYDIFRAQEALRAAIKEAEKQEPVAWMHKHIENNIITHRPADLDRHFDRWEALYKTPPPCPTCEALARTVMMDQTSHDMAPRQWQGLTDEDVDEVA